MSTSATAAANHIAKSRKPGVVTDEEMTAFIATNGATVVVVDARNTDFEVEKDDERSHALGPIAGTAKANRPRAVNVPYDRVHKSMDLAAIPEALLVAAKDTPIITHCGGGGRGQKAKLFLESKGFTNVMNGGGPSVKELWAMFGSK